MTVGYMALEQQNMLQAPFRYLYVDMGPLVIRVPKQADSGLMDGVSDQT